MLYNHLIVNDARETLLEIILDTPLSINNYSFAIFFTAWIRSPEVVTPSTVIV